MLITKIWNKFVENQYLKIKGNLAYYDELTGVFNRNYYDRFLKPYYANKECWIIFVDCDQLKKINDTYGHVTGSNQIKNISQQIIKFVPHDFIARTGGDEFIVFSNTSLSLDFSIEGASWGQYQKEKYEDVSSAVAKADFHMYQQKQQKKSQRESSIDKCLFDKNTDNIVENIAINIIEDKDTEDNKTNTKTEHRKRR